MRTFRASEVGALIAYVRDEGNRALILDSCGTCQEEIEYAGCIDIIDLDMPLPKRDGFGAGLAFFEGWRAHEGDPEPDIKFYGQWRNLSFSETVKLTRGLDPLGSVR